jgi:hypothetical protein
MTLAFIQVAEYCPMCGAEVFWTRGVTCARLALGNFGVETHYEWRECSYCGWESKHNSVETTWASSGGDGDTPVYAPPGAKSYTR